MPDATLRIDEEVAEMLRKRAERQGLSLNKLATQILQREVEVGPVGTSAPQILPVGLGPVFEDFRRDTEGKARANWFVVYRDSSGVPLVVVGLLSFETMFLKVELFGKTKATLLIPRVALIGWQKMQAGTQHEIITFTQDLQQWGAYLHELVHVDGREVNGIFWPPRRPGPSW